MKYHKKNIIDLILDVKIYIASFDENVWINMVLYDKEFKKYAYKKEGLKQFVAYFTKVADNQTRLLGRLHSINDLPAHTNDGNLRWYYNGNPHRENDLPACINVNGNMHWYYNGNRHRENDLPAITTKDEQYWFYDGEQHRENNLPAVICINGIKQWWYEGRWIQSKS